MTDRNYNEIDLFDIKGFKTCEQVREEKLKEKVGGLKMRKYRRNEKGCIVAVKRCYSFVYNVINLL